MEAPKKNIVAPPMGRMLTAEQLCRAVARFLCAMVTAASFLLWTLAPWWLVNYWAAPDFVGRLAAIHEAVAAAALGVWFCWVAVGVHCMFRLLARLGPVADNSNNKTALFNAEEDHYTGWMA